MNSDLLIVYASQTGNAEAIAQEIAQDLSMFLNLKFDPKHENTIVFVVSTTGDGEPPDVALKMWKHLQKHTDSLDQLRYTILGLGDTDYSEFNNFAKLLNNRLKKLGASCFLDCAYADDAVGLEEVVEPWKEKLYECISHMIKLNKSSHDAGIQAQPLEIEAQESDMSIDFCSNVYKAYSENENEHRICADCIAMRMSQANDDKVATANGNVLEDTMNLGVHEVSDATVGDSMKHMRKVVDKFVGKEVSDKHSNDYIDIDGSESVNVGTGIPASREWSVCSICKCKYHGPHPSTQQTLSVGSVRILSRLGLSVDANVTYSPHTLFPPWLVVSSAPSNDTIEDKDGCMDATTCEQALEKTYTVNVMEVRRLTASRAAKQINLVKLDLRETGLVFEPGDAFGVLVNNLESEIDAMLNAIHFTGNIDMPVRLSLSTDSTRTELPMHLPDRGTLRTYLMQHVDIRRLPRQWFMRVLAEHTTDSDEKGALLFLSSREGLQLFERFKQGVRHRLSDVLAQLKTVTLPIGRILEALQSLVPRYYSAASCPLSCPESVQFAFTVVNFPGYSEPFDKGVCTGWLEHLPKAIPIGTRSLLTLSPIRVEKRINSTTPTPAFATPTPTSEQTHTATRAGPSMSTSKISNITKLQSSPHDTLLPQIRIFRKPSPHFRLPIENNPHAPLIMIGAGTGIAPYIGFLEHKALLLGKPKFVPRDDHGQLGMPLQQQRHEPAHRQLSSQLLGKDALDLTWLFYGCRNALYDSIFEDELNKFLETGVLTRLTMSYSRDSCNHHVKYVQDNISAYGADIYNLMENHGAYIYVCGDGKHMAVDVDKALCTIVSRHCGGNDTQARDVLTGWSKHGRYLKDVWS
eukprot:CFRG7844T1